MDRLINSLNNIMWFCFIANIISDVPVLRTSEHLQDEWVNIHPDDIPGIWNISSPTTMFLQQANQDVTMKSNHLRNTCNNEKLQAINLFAMKLLNLSLSFQKRYNVHINIYLIVLNHLLLQIGKIWTFRNFLTS